MIFKGYKFGMLLQLAVGPMCLLVFSTSTSHGFIKALTLVIAIALVDAIYIILSGFGVATIIGKEKVKTLIKSFGGIVLIIFGINTILGILHLSILPNIAIFQEVSDKNIFIKGLLLTASNPLTIIFWSGVFSTQVVENNLTRKQLSQFGMGCVLSTLTFLTFIATLGTIISGFLPLVMIQILNVIVGIALIYFGIELFFKK